MDHSVDGLFPAISVSCLSIIQVPIVLGRSSYKTHKKTFLEFQEQMVKLESLAKVGARIQPQKDGSVIFRTSETTTSAPVPGPPGNLQPLQPQMPNQHQVRVSQSKPPE